MSRVVLTNVAKRFGDTPVVHDVSLEIADGELVALLGPSGSGKTTLLRMIAGFETIDAGTVHFDGDDVTARSALERRCGMVFQHYALFPHLSVGENVAYGLERERLDAATRAARVSEVLAMVDLAGFETRQVHELSGGQQQRVAVARALAPRPRVLLLDEPLSNLDPSLRERTRRELRDLVRRIGITTLLVTHEQEEAFDLADRIAVLHRGRLEQVGTPAALYRTPATPFVAGFVGRTSTLHGRVMGVTDGHLEVEAAGVRWLATGNLNTRGAVLLLVRPEGAWVDATGSLSGVLRERRFAGATTILTLLLATGEEIEVSVESTELPIGAEVRLRPAGAAAHAFADRDT
ncbi:MAG: ABC transporter ATP-binding protein [Gemmatimonadota bacterium]